MGDLSRKTASIYINHQPAEDALKALQLQADKLQEKIKKGEAAGKGMVTEISKLNKVQNDMKGIQQQIDNGLRPSFNQLQTTVSKLRNELKRMSEDAPGYAAKFKSFQAASLEMDRLGQKIGTVRKESGGLKDLLKEALPAVGLLAVADFFKGAVDEAMEAQLHTDRFKNALDNAGRSDAFERLAKQADDLAKSVGYLDNDDLVGVFEKLTSYGKLTEGQMSKLAPIIVDFAAKTRQSLPEATDAILKSLEGNAKALKTFGINIKEAGTEEERFKIITTELAGKVEGSAKTFSETFAGSLATSKQQVKELKEEIGNKLIPILDKLLKGANIVADGIGSAFRSIRNGRFFADQIDVDKALKEGTDWGDAMAKWREGDFKKFETMFGDDFNHRNIFINRMMEGEKKSFATFQAELDEANKTSNATRIQTAQMNFTRSQKLLDYWDQQLSTSKQEQAKMEDEKTEKKKEQDEKNLEAQKAASEKARKEAIAAFLKLQKDINDLMAKNQDELDKLHLSPFYYDLQKADKSFAEEQDKLNKAYAAKAINEDQFNKAMEVAVELHEAKIKESKDKFRKESAEARDKYNNQSANKEAAAEAEQMKLYKESKDKEKDFDQTIQGIYDDCEEAAWRAKVARYEELKKKIINTLDDIKKYGTTVLDLYGSIDTILKSREDAKIAEKNKQFDAETARNKRLLDNKGITQQEYDKRETKLQEKKDKEIAAIKLKSWKREQNIKTVNILLNGVEGASQTIAKLGYPFAIPALIIEAAMIAAQIAAVRSAKPPQFARGGVFDGPSHSQGGMPVYNRGRKVAELEGGEPILSRKTYANNRGIVDSLLYSSLYHDGAAIRPQWQNRPYQGMNFTALNQGLTSVRRFERGGILGTNGFDGTGSGANDISNALFAFVEFMKQPIRAYVPYSEINATAELDAKVKSETTFSKK